MPRATGSVGRIGRQLAELWPHLRAERGSIALLIAASAPVGFLQAGVVALVAETAVALAAGEPEVTFGASALTFRMPIATAIWWGVATAIVLIGLNVITSWTPARIVANAQARLREHVFRRFVHASWSVQSQEADGHLQEVMTTQVDRAALMLLGIAKAVPTLLTFVGLVASAFLLSPVAAALMLVAGTAMFLALRPVARRTRDSATDHAAASEEFAAAVNESVVLGEEYHVFGVEDAQAAFVADRIESVRGPFEHSKFMLDLVGGLYGGVVLLLLVGGLAALQLVDAAELGAIGAVVLVLLRALGSGKGLQTAYTQAYNHLPYLERALASLRSYEAAAVTYGDRPFGEVTRFAFEDVGYAYDHEGPALTGVTFDIPAGTSVGIVGPSGAGKSTLVQLLLRLRHPDHGRFLVDGVPAEEYDHDEWAAAVAYVPQVPKLLRGTVADNIRFHRSVPPEDVERAARLAHIHDEIVAMPGGYDRVVGQGAAGVSGGQRQRISLARALATRPRVLILDEPTSALDPTSERAVQDSLRELRELGVTLFIIAHRASTLTSVDHLLVFDDGRLVASGPPAEVVARDPYARDAMAELRAAGASGSPATRPPAAS